MKYKIIVSTLLAIILAPSNAIAVPVVDQRAVSHKGLEDLLLPKRPLNRSKLGVNAFVNDSRFGSIKSQLSEVSTTLKLKQVRMLFNWSDAVQATPDGKYNFGFYDTISRSIPKDVSAIVVLAGLPSWMKDPKNWIDNNPRTTFVKKWVEPVAKRFRSSAGIVGWEIWNEPNMLANPDNTTLDLVNKPENYVEMISLASAAIKRISNRKRVVSAATTAINQNFPSSLNYNKNLVQAGILNAVDVFGIHYYGKQIENVIFPGGVKDFVQTVTKPIWITESGEKGTLKQRDYAQRVFPYLIGLSSNISRIYIYQFTEATPASETYGLKNLTPGKTVSDLYIYLRDSQ